jgi:hypothetical protein
MLKKIESGENTILQQMGSEKSQRINNIKVSWGIKVTESNYVNEVVSFEAVIETIRTDENLKELVETRSTEKI